MATSPSTPTDHMTSVPTDVLLLVERALWESAKAGLTVKGTLDVPYPDDPRWTPWTRWVERATRQAYDACMALRKVLKDAGIERLR